jgi:signal transduction histidine kinase
LDPTPDTSSKSPSASLQSNASDEVAVLERALVEASERIGDLEARLASESRSRSELIHLVCHELRTPITVVSGFGRLLLGESQGVLNAEQRRYVQECLKSCRRLDRFVDDLLEASPDSGTRLPVVLEEGNLDHVIQALLESLAPLLEERGQRVELKLSGEAEVAFDAGRIEQVLTNLMTNAVRYGREGGVIRISSETIAGARSAARVEVSVEDEGPGIAEADRERLFQPYIRGERQPSDGEGGRPCAGLGIGLAICRRIIEAHGGKIRVEPSDLGGARFVFSLPMPRVPVEGG